AARAPVDLRGFDARLRVELDELAVDVSMPTAGQSHVLRGRTHGGKPRAHPETAPGGFLVKQPDHILSDMALDAVIAPAGRFADRTFSERLQPSCQRHMVEAPS